VSTLGTPSPGSALIISSSLFIQAQPVHNTQYYVYADNLMRTNIVLDDELVREAVQLTGIATKRELVDVALRELIRDRRKKDLFELAGKFKFAEGYDYKQARVLRSDPD